MSEKIDSNRQREAGNYTFGYSISPPALFVMLSLSWILINSVALNTSDVLAAFVIFYLIHLVGINEIFFRHAIQHRTAELL
jgi:hypothetical protein